MYVFNEGSIALPSSWKDRSINVISSDGPMEQGLTMTITRDSIPWGMQFEEYVEDQIRQLDDALNDLKVRGKKPITIGKNAAFELECGWLAKQGKMHQIITTVQLPDNKAIILTASKVGEMSPGQMQEMRRVTSSLQLRHKE